MSLEREQDQTVSTISDKETLYGAFKLWVAMFSNTNVLPLPSLKRVIPQYHAKWNATKSGSDTTTKLMDNMVIRQPCINLETAAVSRLIHLGLVYIHRINAIITTKDNLETTISPSVASEQVIGRHTIALLLRFKTCLVTN